MKIKYVMYFTIIALYVISLGSNGREQKQA